MRSTSPRLLLQTSLRVPSPRRNSPLLDCGTRKSSVCHILVDECWSMRHHLMNDFGLIGFLAIVGAMFTMFGFPPPRLRRQTPAPYWMVRGSRWSCFRRSFRPAVGPFHANVRKVTVEAAEARRSESLHDQSLCGASGARIDQRPRPCGRRVCPRTLTRQRVSSALDAVDSRSGT